jgi:hypothetical protein
VIDYFYGIKDELKFNKKRWINDLEQTKEKKLIFRELSKTFEELRDAGLKEMRIRALSGQDMLVDTNNLLKQNRRYASSLSKRSPKNVLKLMEETGPGRNSNSVFRQPASPMRKKS